MANWARSLSQGLQTGLQLGSVLREAQQRSELAKAYGLSPEEQRAAEATPEQLAAARGEAQRLQAQDAAEFGLTPEESARYAPAVPQEGARVALPTYTMGGKTYGRAPTQTEIDDARLRAAADVYGQFGDAARREELMRGLRQEQRSRSQEERSAQGFETQQRLAGLQIGAAQRAADADTNYSNFAKFAAENPNLPVDQLRQAARTKFSLTPDQEEKYILGRLNIQKADADAFKLRVQEKLKGKNLQQQGQLYNTDPDFDDKTDLAIVPGKNGAVTLNFIDKASGRVTSSQSFKNEALATEYLAKQAVDPLNIGTWLQGVQAKDAAINKDIAYTGRLNALGNEDKGLEKKIGDFKKAFGRDPTEQEKQIMFGLVPKPREVSDSDVVNMTKELVGKPTGRMVDGKPERYTYETAVTAARRMLEQQPTTQGMPGWGEDQGAKKQPAAPAATPAPAAPAAKPATAPAAGLGLQIDRETEELATGMRTAYSPEVQAILDARAGARKSAEQGYLQREQALATGRGLWR